MIGTLGRRICIGAALMAAFALIAEASWFREVEVTAEPEADGKRDVTVRLRPETTHRCDQIEFECVYHQEFPWEDTRGKQYTKVHEPVSFVYRRSDVKLVNDLDCFISFRVPMDRRDLEARYGNKTFNRNHPITIRRMIITAKSNGQVLWKYEIPIPGRLDAAALDLQDRPPPAEAPEEEPAEGASLPAPTRP